MSRNKNRVDPGRARDLLRAVAYPGFSRDIVGAGFVRGIAVDGPRIVVEFAPDTRNDDKVAEMERGIRGVLYDAGFVEVRIRTKRPFDGDSLLLGDGGLNPLQVDLLDDGIPPQADAPGDSLRRADVAREAGYREEGAKACEGPRGPDTLTYEGKLPVLQWDIDPHDVEAERRETEVMVDGWTYRVWWQLHPHGDLAYASLQAMREDWVVNAGVARSHPVGRSQAVNLVYDLKRKAVVAIYGTVRDFRPFVEAFGQAWANELGETPGPANREEYT